MKAQTIVLDGTADGFGLALDFRIEGVAGKHDAIQYVLAFVGVHLVAFPLELIANEVGVGTHFVDEDAAFALFDDLQQAEKQGRQE